MQLVQCCLCCCRRSDGVDGVPKWLLIGGASPPPCAVLRLWTNSVNSERGHEAHLWMVTVHCSSLGGLDARRGIGGYVGVAPPWAPQVRRVFQSSLQQLSSAL